MFHPKQSINWCWFGGLFFLLAILKIFLLVLDSTPMLFLGDSSSYIHTALTGWVPSDRSYLYGLFLRYSTALGGSLLSLVIIQALLSVCTAGVLAFILYRHFGCSKTCVFVITVLFSLEPLQLLYERFVLAETIALFFFSVTFALLCEYLRTGFLRWFLASQVLAVVVVSFRTSFIPIMLVFILLAPLLCVQSAKESTGASQKSRAIKAVWAVFFAGVVFFGLVSVTGTYIEKKASGQADYSDTTGLFLVSIVAPLIVKRDFSNVDVADKILDDLPCDLSNIHRREAQRWSKGCLSNRFMETLSSRNEGNSEAFYVAINAVIRDPVGFFRLGLKTYMGFWDDRLIKSAIKHDSGRRVVPEGLKQSLLLHYNFATDDLHMKVTITRYYFENAIAWFRLILLSPLLLLLVLFPGRYKSPHYILTSMAALVFVVITSYLVTLNVVRYLHPIAFIFSIQLAVILSTGTNSVKKVIKFYNPK